MIFLEFYCYLIFNLREDVVYSSPVSILLLSSNKTFITYPQKKKKVEDPPRTNLLGLVPVMFCRLSLFLNYKINKCFVYEEIGIPWSHFLNC